MGSDGSKIMHLFLNTLAQKWVDSDFQPAQLYSQPILIKLVPDNIQNFVQTVTEVMRRAKVIPSC